MGGKEKKNRVSLRKIRVSEVGKNLRETEKKIWTYKLGGIKSGRILNVIRIFSLF